MGNYKVTLKAARVNAELTQTEAGSILGVSKETIINWELGRIIPKGYQLEALCNLYGVPKDNIFLPTKSPERG